jgi:hypothetical protein
VASASVVQTEWPFTLPCGYLDADGTLHCEGIMRRATAYDEIAPLKDPRVVANNGYLVIILLARVIVRLGTLDELNPRMVEQFFASDLAYLQNLYSRMNGYEDDRLIVTCPHCEAEFEVETLGLGE